MIQLKRNRTDGMERVGAAIAQCSFLKQYKKLAGQLQVANVAEITLDSCAFSVQIVNTALILFSFHC
jgi:hypothetical protein